MQYIHDTVLHNICIILSLLLLIYELGRNLREKSTNELLFSGPVASSNLSFPDEIINVNSIQAAICEP